MASYINNYFYFSPQETTLAHRLQDAILSGDVASLKASLTSAHLSLKLPNGELPLHFAVRKGKTEIVRALIEQGANPFEKDFQELTAVDHAFLQKNKDCLRALFEQKIEAQLTKAIDEQNLSQTSHAYQDIMKIKNGEQSYNLLQQAVLASDFQIVEQWLERGGDTRRTTLFHNSTLLHLAAFSNSPAVIDLLIKHGVDITVKDQSGKTAAHYAATNPNGAILARLIKHGADLSIKDDRGVTPLALLGWSAQLGDPLNLTTAHALMFAATLLQVAAYAMIQTGFAEEKHQLILRDVVKYAAIFAEGFEFSVHLQSVDKTLRKILLMSFRILGFDAIPVIGTSIKAWTTIHVARSVFNGIKAAYDNVQYRSWKAVRNFLVYTSNGGVILNNIMTRLKSDWVEAHFFKEYLSNLYNANSEEETHTAYKQLFLFLENRPYMSGFFKLFGLKSDVDTNPVDEVDPGELVGLNDVERIGYKKLDPTALSHALLMYDSSFTEKSPPDPALLRQLHRKLMLLVHPDKNGAEKLAERLNMAKETIEKATSMLRNL